MNKKIIIASRTHPQYGDVYVGFQNRDEPFVQQGFYKMQGNDLEDLSNFIPPACTCIQFNSNRYSNEENTNNSRSRLIDRL